MKLSIAEFEHAICVLNSCLQKKQEKLELLEKAINAFIEEEALQGKSYKSAKNYFRDMHLLVVRGMILAYGEIQTANTNCLNDLYFQVSSDSTMKIDTEGLSYCIEEAKRTLNQLEDLEQNSPFAQMQRANLQKLENEITKVTYFNLYHTNHYDTAQSYMSAVKAALSGFQHRSFDPKTKTYKYKIKNKAASKKINKHWLKYQYDQMIKDCIMEDGKIDFKKLNSDFWNRNDGYFDGHWWQDPDKLATAAYVLKLEAEAYGELNIVDMISQYQEGEANPRLNTLQALANAPRVSYYDISLIDAITGNLYASGINYDETKGTINVEDIEALAEREKNIKFKEVGNWLENGGGMLVDGVMIIAGAAIVTSMLNSTSEPISKPASEPNVTSTRKYKIGQSPRIKSSTFTRGNKGTWDMTEGGRIINGRKYSQHAMERMAPDTPSVRAELSRRAEALAESKGLKVGSQEYYEFCKKYVNPRNISPSVIEDAIRNTKGIPGHTKGTFVHETSDVKVIINSSGKVITVIPK